MHMGNDLGSWHLIQKETFTRPLRIEDDLHLTSIGWGEIRTSLTFRKDTKPTGEKIFVWLEGKTEKEVVEPGAQAVPVAPQIFVVTFNDKKDANPDFYETVICLDWTRDLRIWRENPPEHKNDEIIHHLLTFVHNDESPYTR